MAKKRTDTESVLKLVIDNEQAKTSVKELKDTYFKLTAEINNMKRADDPARYDKMVSDVQKVERAWKEAREEIRGATKSSSDFKNSLTDLAKQAAAGLSVAGVFYGITNGIKTAISKNAELSDVMAGVMKTTGLTEEAVDRLNEKFKKMDTRTANTQLLELAHVAGKLGYSAEKDVEGFVRAADKIGVALGEDLGGVEESVRSLGKLVNIFKLTDEFELEDALLKVGSAINTLGQSGTAAESRMIDFTQRLAGVAPAANIALPTVLAYGAVLDELGQSMESSSTALGQFIIGLGRDVPKYSKIAGVSQKEFSQLLMTDTNEALLKVLENSKTAGGGIQALATNMGILEVSGARGISALGAMADNTELLRKRIETSKDSFEEGTSVIDEFNVVNNNLAANLEKIGNRLDQMWQRSGFRKWMTDVTASILDSRTEFERLNEEFNRSNSELQTLEKSLVPAIDRYDELTGKSELNASEQEELRRIIVQLSEQWPIAVNEVDAYGNALSINTSILRNNIEEHQNYLRHLNDVAIKEANVEKERKKRYADQLERELYERKVREFGGSAGTGGGGGSMKERALSNDELKEKRDLLSSVKSEISAIDYSLGLMGVNTRKAFDTKPMVEHSAVVLNNADAIEKRIKELQDVLGAEDTSMLQFIEAEQGLKVLRKRLGELNNLEDKPKAGVTGNKKDDKKAQREREQQERLEKQAKEHLARLLKEEELFAAQQEIDRKDKNEREIAQLELSYQQKIEKFKEFASKEGALEKDKETANSQIAKLEADREDAVTKLKLKHEQDLADSIAAIRQELSRKQQSEQERERDRINKHYDQLKKDATGDEAQIAKIEEARAVDLTDAKIREEERLAEVKRKLEDEAEAYGKSKWKQKETEIKNRYNREIALLKERNSAEIQESEAFKEVLKAYEANKAKELAELEKQRQWERRDFAIGIAQSIADATFSIISNNIQAESNARLSALDKQREQELSAKGLTEKQKKTINDKYDKLQRAEKLRAWKAQQKADILSAVINTALAVTKALPNLFLAAAAGAAGAAQVAVIGAQKAPQFEKGGFIPKGPRHSRGGINLVGPDGVIGNMEGGEPILSRNTYANNRDIVDALLYSGQRKNGARIVVHPEALDAERAVRNGGRSPIVNVPAPIINIADKQNDIDNTEVIALLRKIAEKESSVLMSNRLFEDHAERNVKIRDSVNA